MWAYGARSDWHWSGFESDQRAVAFKTLQKAAWMGLSSGKVEQTS